MKIESYDKIYNKFIYKFEDIVNKKYLKVYIKFCINNHNEIKQKYMETHHILPKNKKSFPENKYDNWNLVNLEYIDHLKAHYLLYKSLKTKENVFSLVRVLGNRNLTLKNIKEVEKYYIKSKIEFKNFMSSEKNPHIGKKRSDESKERMSIAHRKWHSENKKKIKRMWVTNSTTEEILFIDSFLYSNYDKSIWVIGRKNKKYIEKISLSHLGKIHPEATKLKMSLSHKKISGNHHMKSPEKRLIRSIEWKNNNPSRRNNEKIPN